VNKRTSKDSSGGNALWLAEDGGHGEIVKMLEQNGGIGLLPDKEQDIPDVDDVYVSNLSFEQVMYAVTNGDVCFNTFSFRDRQ
jgi:hypothetical protein